MNEYLREYAFEDELKEPVKVCQSSNPEIGFGSTVWDAALVLCAFVESKFGSDLLQGSTCIELGSGTGIVSLALAASGVTRVVATDLEQCIPLIRQNIGLNPQCQDTCRAEALDWSTEIPEEWRGTFDWVLCADCVYDPSTVESLVKTVHALNPKKGIIVSNELRDTETNAAAEKQFIGAMYAAGFTGRAVQKDVLRPEWRCEDIDVVVFEKVDHSVKGA